MKKSIILFIAVCCLLMSTTNIQGKEEEKRHDPPSELTLTPGNTFPITLVFTSAQIDGKIFYVVVDEPGEYKFKVVSTLPIDTYLTVDGEVYQEDGFEDKMYNYSFTAYLIPGEIYDFVYLFDQNSSGLIDITLSQKIGELPGTVITPETEPVITSPVTSSLSWKADSESRIEERWFGYSPAKWWEFKPGEKMFIEYTAPEEGYIEITSWDQNETPTIELSVQDEYYNILDIEGKETQDGVEIHVYEGKKYIIGVKKTSGYSTYVNLFVKHNGDHEESFRAENMWKDEWITIDPVTIDLYNEPFQYFTPWEAGTYRFETRGYMPVTCRLKIDDIWGITYKGYGSSSNGDSTDNINISFTKELVADERVKIDLSPVFTGRGTTEFRITKVSDEAPEIVLPVDSSIQGRRNAVRNTYTSVEWNNLTQNINEINRLSGYAALPGDCVITDSQSIKFDTPPVVKNSRTLVPVRAIVEGFGAEVSWNGTEQSVLIKKDSVEMKLTIDSVNTLVNGKTVTLDVPAEIMNDRTYVPLRFIAENLGLKVTWHGDTQTIELGNNPDVPSTEVVVNDTVSNSEINTVASDVIIDRGISYEIKNSEVSSYKITDYPTNTITSYYYSDGWIYYTENELGYRGGNLYKSRVDGLEKTLLLDQSSVVLGVIDDYIYYGVRPLSSNDYTPFESVSKMKLDGTSSQSITNVNGVSGKVYKGDLYVRTEDYFGEFRIYTGFVEGKVMEPFDFYMTGYTFDDSEKLYFSKDNMNTWGTFYYDLTSEKFYKLQYQALDHMNIYKDGVIGIPLNGNTLVYMSDDGDIHTTIVYDELYNYWMIDNRIYYISGATLMSCDYSGNDTRVHE